MKRLGLPAGLISALIGMVLIPISPAHSAQTFSVAESDVVTQGSCVTNYAHCTKPSSYSLIADTSSGYLTYLLTPGAGAVLTQGGQPLTTEQANYRAGAVFFESRVDLSQPFDIYAELNFDNEAGRLGADGIAFVIQNESSSTLFGGGGLGYGGMKPVVAVEFDTWRNASAPVPWDDINPADNLFAVTQDAWGLLGRAWNNSSTDSATDHGTYGVLPQTTSAQSQYLLQNLEDGLWKPVRFTWDPTSQSLSGFVDANSDGDYLDANEMLEWSINIAGTYLNSNFAYLGFTGAVGGAPTKQQIRFSQSQQVTFTQRTNTPPTIAAQSNVTVDVGSSEQSIDLGLADDDTTTLQWRVKAVSSDQAVATVSNVVTGATNTRLSISPLAVGTTTITVEAFDADGASATRTFTFTVRDPNAPQTPAVEDAPAPAPVYAGPVPGLLNGGECIPAGSPQNVVLDGRRLDSIGSAEIDGLAAKVIQASPDSLNLEIPALKSGVYSVTYFSSFGRLTHIESLKVCEVKTVAVVEPESSMRQELVSKRFTGFIGDRPALSAKDQRLITKFVSDNRGLTNVTCIGSTSARPAKSTDAKLAMDRAINACQLVQELLPGVKVKTISRPAQGVGQFFRAVSIFGIKSIG